MDTEEFYKITINKLRNDMNIGDGKKIYIIQGRGSECVDEDPPMLVDENETVEEYFKSNETTLYVSLCNWNNLARYVYIIFLLNGDLVCL
jgi:hypothetical protein